MKLSAKMIGIADSDSKASVKFCVGVNSYDMHSAHDAKGVERRNASTSAIQSNPFKEKVGLTVHVTTPYVRTHWGGITSDSVRSLSAKASRQRVVADDTGSAAYGIGHGGFSVCENNRIRLAEQQGDFLWRDCGSPAERRAA